jgi:hypothetical protein
MTTTIAIVMTAVALAAGLSAAQDKKADTPTVTGTWNMGLQGDHVIPVALVLDQDGTIVTGTIVMPTQRTGQPVDVRLSGEFADRALTLSGTVEGAKEPTTLELTGRLTDEGTLEGTLVSRHGTMPWTAERLKVRK